MEAAALSAGITSAMLLGLSFGAGPCMLSCAPTLGTVLATKSGLTARKSMGMTARFNGGRMAAYTLMAALSGAAGASLEQLFGEEPVNLLMAAAIFLSAWMLWQDGNKSCDEKHRFRPSINLGLFGIGFAMGLRPCAPMATVLGAAALTGSFWQGGLLGLAFGLGSVILPQLIFGLGFSLAGSQIRSQMATCAPHLGKAGAVVLMMTGIGVAGGWVSL